MMMNEPLAPLSQYHGPAGALAWGAYQGAAAPTQYGAPAATPTGYAQDNPYPAQGAYQKLAPPAQYGVPVLAHAGYAQGNPYPAQGAYQKLAPPTQYGVPVLAHAGYAQGNPTQVLVVMAPPSQHTAPPPNRKRRFLEGCLAIFCCCLRNGNIPSDPSCDDVCPSCDDVCLGDCF